MSEHIDTRGLPSIGLEEGMKKEDVKKEGLQYVRPILLQIPTRLSVTMTEKMAKRIIAPYVTMEKRGGQRVTLRRGADAYSFYLTKKSSLLMKNLSAFLSNNNDLPGLLYETTEVLKALTDSLGGRLYMVDNATNLLHHYERHVTYARCRVNYEIAPGTSVAPYVAYTKEYVCVEDVTRDSRFPEGVKYKETVKPVLAVPIVINDACYAVLEFYRDMYQLPYTKNDMKMVVLVCGWVGLAIQQNRDGVLLHLKQEISDDLLHMVLAYFGKLITFENLLADILSYTKSHLSAECGVIYNISEEDEVMYADVYEDGITSDKDVLIKKRIRVKVGKERTVASLVAQTRELLNLRDVHNDPRFNHDSGRDGELMVIIRSELCAPIQNNNELLGILTMVNKKNGLFFTPDDESLIKIVATYTCMALHHANSLRENEIAALKLEESLTLLDYHLRPCEHNLREMEDECTVPRNIREYSWYIIPEEIALMPQLYIHMLCEIVGEEHIEMNVLRTFIVTVQRCYRNTAYHNFEHAFNVSHCMFCMLMRNKCQFSLTERQALLIATILHDIDHEGVNNNFLLISNHLLSQLYNSSPWENHHVFVAMRILRKYKVFNNLDEENYEIFLERVKESIMATDLVYYFKARTDLLPLVQSGVFDLANPYHRTLTKKLMMTMCDLSGQTKPFSVCKRITDGLYEEFYAQGDMEKKMGFFPLPTLDRNCQNTVPVDQAQFVTLVVMQCAYLLKEILSGTEEMYTNAEILRDCWRKIIELSGSKIWRQGDSIIQQ